MKTKTAVAILLVAIFALSLIAIQIKPARASVALTLSDAELMSASFAYEWNGPPGTFTGKTLVGPGVRFGFTNLGKVGMGDNFPLDALAGGTDEDNANFTAFSKYSMLFINAGPDAVQVHVFMNTGFTSPPQSDAYNTFWASSWTTIGAGHSAVVTLDFSSCGEAWSVADDPVPEWRHTEGTGGFPVQRLDQVTNIGFEVLGGGGSAASIIASGTGTGTQLYLNPSSVTKAFADVGSTFPVNVMLSDFAYLAGFDIKLTWDESLINKTAVDTYTTALDALWGAGKWSVFEYSGAGYYELVAAALATSASNSGASALFTLTFQVKNKDSNVPLSTPITFDIHKLSDNATPVPNPITSTVTNGLYTYSGNTVPDLEFKVKVKNRQTGIYEYKNPPYFFEYCRWVEVEVWATDISDNSKLTEYNLVIQYNPESIRFDGADYWSDFGTGSATDSPTGTITVTCVGGPSSGPEFLLFALTFHVEFTKAPEHMWKYGQTNHLTNSISISDATLTFGISTIPKSGIAIPSAVAFEVDFIRGDVTCNGLVLTDDIGDVAFYYGQTVPPHAQYDLNNDGIIDIYDIVTVATNYGYPGLNP